MVIPLRLLLVAAVLPVTALTVPTAQAVEGVQTLESVHVDNTPRVVTPRVVNGREPGTGEVGSLVYVQAGGIACSGTLVDATHVITAAHCVTTSTGAPLSASRVSVGWSATIFRSGLVMVPVTRIAVAPDYSPRTYVNDIAVITLAAPIAGATPMTVTTEAGSAQALAPGVAVRSAGYGSTTATGGRTDRALVADLTVIPNSVCSRTDKTYVVGGVTFTGLGIDTTTAVCAIGVRLGTSLLIDTCYGDSGGPLYAGNGTGERLVGVVSVGIGCAGFDDRGAELPDKKPAVYTRVAPYLDWLAASGVQVKETAPAAPLVSATRSGADGILATFTPGDSVAVLSYEAVATNITDPSDVGSCTSSARAASCTITGLTPGATYNVLGFALAASEQSAASVATSVTVGGPNAKPTKPRIESATMTPGRRLLVLVSASDDPTWTRTRIICRDGVDVYRADVTAGRTVMTLPRRRDYLCFAKSTNNLGSTRSQRIPVSVP